MPRKPRFTLPRYFYGILLSAVLILVLIITGLRLLRPASAPKGYTAIDLAALNAGITSLNQGNPDQAIQDFSQVIQTNPHLGEAYNNRGLAYQAKGSLDLALADFEQAVELLPKEAAPYNNRGSVYFAQSNYQKALDDFSQAIQRDAGFAKAYYNRGAVYLSTDNYEQAVSDFSHAIALTPAITVTQTTINGSSIDLTMAIAQRYANLPLTYANRGSAYLSLGDLPGAQQDLNTAIALQPDLALAYYYRGLTYYAALDYPSAITDFTKVLALNNNPEVQDLARLRLTEIGSK